MNLKVLGIVASVVGAAASVAGAWVGSKQQEAKIAEEVAKALAPKED